MGRVLLSEDCKYAGPMPYLDQIDRYITATPVSAEGFLGSYLLHYSPKPSLCRLRKQNNIHIDHLIALGTNL